MRGAREFSKLFKTGQYGRLYIVSSSHARGNTFRIQVLPKKEKAVLNGTGNECLNDNAVLVYGVVSGNLGWTEEYGWLHKGKWQEDFYKLVGKRKDEIENTKKQVIKEMEDNKENDQERTKKLLDNY